MSFTLLFFAMAPLLREARRSAGLTQAQLAARLGSTQPVVARLERPDSNPTWRTLVRALHATGHDVKLVRRPAMGSLDLGQLRERLALTPAERLWLFERSQQRMLRLAARARRVA
jgi:transcriptional regulator with XRE-family HTH domain